MITNNSKNILSIAILIFIDFLLIYFLVDIAYYLRIFLNDVIIVTSFNMPLEKYKEFYLLYLIVIGLLFHEGIYFQRYDFWEEFKNIIKAICFSFVFTFTFLSLSKISIEYSRLFFIIYFILLALILPISKIIVKNILYKMNLWKKYICVIGNKEQSNIVSNEITSNKYLGYETSNKSDAHTILIATKDMETNKLKRLLDIELSKTREVILIPYLDNYNISNTKMFELFNTKMSFLSIENKLLVKYNIVIKRLFEYLITFITLPIFVVVFIIISFFIKLDSKGSVLFRQSRLGFNGRSFSCLKFRTMYENQSELLKNYLDKNPLEIEYYDKYHKYNNDPRITNIGKILRKFSLDELPQFINVLKSEMSLIGPRPYMNSESGKLKHNQEILLKVKPGITGLWQVSGRNNISFDERVKIDIWYIQNWTLWLDMIIFLKTFKVLLFKTGAK